MRVALRKAFCGVLAPLLVASLVNVSFAQSSKFAANVKDLTIIPETDDTGGFVQVLKASIKTANKKDLLIGVSLETGLYTETSVKGKGGDKGTSTAEAGIFVKVEVDGQQADPEVSPTEVIFDERLQELTATLGGVLSDCEDLNGDGIISVDECTLTDEEIGLILKTMSAHHFNYVARDLPSGDHEITVHVLGTTDTTSVTEGDATTEESATVTVGRGSLTVEEVRAINQEGGIVFE